MGLGIKGWSIIIAYAVFVALLTALCMPAGEKTDLTIHDIGGYNEEK